MSAKSQSRLPDLLTGLFVLAVVALLAFFTIVISGVDILRGRHDVLHEARFENVGTLREQDPVTVRGMKVGTVQSLTLEKDHVVVAFTIDANVPLQADAHAAIDSTSVLGGSALALDQGASPDPLPQGAILPGRAPNDVMDELGELLADLRQSFDPADVRTLIVNLRGASANLADITGRIRAGEGLLGQLLDDNAPLATDLEATVANLRQASASLSDPDTTLGALLAKDSTLVADLQTTAANLRDVSQRRRQLHPRRRPRSHRRQPPRHHPKDQRRPRHPWQTRQRPHHGQRDRSHHQRRPPDYRQYARHRPHHLLHLPLLRRTLRGASAAPLIG